MNQPSRSPLASSSEASPGALVLTGLPDDGELHVKRGTGLDGIKLVYPGTADFLGEMPDDIQRWPRLVLPLRRDARVEVPRLPVVNHMGDADRYSVALRQAAVVVERLGTPCLNRPTAVLRTTRDGIYAALQDIAGVLVPRTVRILPSCVEDFARAVEREGFRYPVIARLAGTQTGRTQTLVESADAWSKFHGIAWREREVYLTQYVDCRDPDGLHRKQRVALIGGRPMPNSLLMSTNWCVHGADRRPEHELQEARWLKSFDAESLPDLRDRLAEITRRVGLDVCGIDFALRPDGTMVIFEVNAAMTLVWIGVLNRLPYLGPSRHAIRNELIALLRDPSRWGSFTA